MKCPEQANRDRKQIGGCHGLGEGEWGMTANSYGVSFWVDENILELGTGDSCIIL